MFFQLGKGVLCTTSNLHLMMRSKFYYQWLLAYEFKDMRSIDISDAEAASRLAEALLACPASQSPAPSAAPHVLSPSHSGLSQTLPQSYGRSPLHSAAPGWTPAVDGYGGAAAGGGRASEPPSPRPPPQTPGHAQLFALVFQTQAIT